MPLAARADEPVAARHEEEAHAPRSGKAGGMYVMIADNVRGPYRLVEGDPLLLGCRNAPPKWAYTPAYFMRACQVDNTTLVYHHWMPRDNFLDAWLGTVKVLEEKKPGLLALKYWSGNDALQGKQVFDLKAAPSPATPFTQSIPSAQWRFAEGVLTGKATGSALAYFDLEPSFEDGIVLEMMLSVTGEGAAGLFFGTKDHGAKKPYEGVACLANRRGLYEFGAVTYGPCGPVFMAENNVARPVDAGRLLAWRVLLRGEFIELYVANELVQCFGFSAPPAHNIGIFVERAEVVLDSLKVCHFA